MQEGTYVGPNTCGGCHPEHKAHWEETGHAVAWNSSSDREHLEECGQGCHINGTNYETGVLIGQDLYGFTATNDPVEEGVTCETCHGPYQGGAGEDHQFVSLAAELCGECHSPRHSTHGKAYERWSASDHAISHEKLLEPPNENPYCMHCNTAEGFVWDVQTLDEVENGITCAVCHDPHSHENPTQLRAETVNELCIICHSHETEDAPHLQREYYDWDTEETVNVDCATCHMYGADYTSRAGGFWDKNVNHTMAANVASCGQEDLNTNITSCHNDPAVAWEEMEHLMEMGLEKITETEAIAEAAFTVFETANATTSADPDLLAKATEVYESLDDHMGEIGHAGTSAFHAPWYLEELLDEATLEAQELTHLSEAAMEPGKTVTITVGENGLLILTVLGLSSALLLAGLRRRRIT